MAKMSSYSSVETFSAAEKETFLDSAMCIATGSKTVGGSKVTANIPIDDIKPAKLSDLADDITQQTVVVNDIRPVSGAAVSSALSSFGSYTKVTVTANTPTDNGHTYGSDDTKFYNQSMTISNNTYSLVSNVATLVGAYGDEPADVENLAINLAQTDFPMAVVEFRLLPEASVTNIAVTNGNTALTRMVNDYNISVNKYTYATARGTSAANYTTVQVQIFGNCYTVVANTPCVAMPS